MEASVEVPLAVQKEMPSRHVVAGWEKKQQPWALALGPHPAPQHCAELVKVWIGAEREAVIYPPSPNLWSSM